MSARAEVSGWRRPAAWLLFGLICSIWLASLVLEALTRPQPNETTLFGNVVFVLGLSAFAIVGWLITVRRPTSRIGWLCMWIGLAWGLGALVETYAIFAIHEGRGSFLLGRFAVVLNDMIWIPGIGLLSFILLLFPDGSPPSPRWRWILYVGGGAIAIMCLLSLLHPSDFSDAGFPNVTNPLGIEALRPLEIVFFVLIPVLPLSMLAAAAGLVVRYRRSSGTERLQLKWLVAAGSFVVVLYAVVLLSFFTFLEEGVWSDFLGAVVVGSFGLVPAAIGAAILKHRLYDIDVVINRTLVYGSLAFFITMAYVGIVVGIGRVIGSTRNLGLSIAATAVVAVAFQPMRERVQRFANRLVYGKRATPYEILSEFSGGMAQIIATEELLPHTARIVAEGTGARRADVWLMVGSELVLEASWPADAPRPATAPVVQGAELVTEYGVTAIPVRHHGELLGVIAITKAPGEAINAAESKLLDDLASQAGLVLRNVRLLEEIKISRQRLVTAQDEERRRLERNLHDGAQQRLVAIALGLKMARNLVKDEADPVAERIDQASEELTLALAELREFARGIHPAILTERGLDAALRSLAERSPVPAVLDSSLNGRVSDAVETTVYFAVSEALTNVAKYSQASQVKITAGHHDGSLHVTVEDDGIGGADPTRGSGLRGLADRVAVVDGELEIHSKPGEGTRLTFRIPVSTPTGVTQ